MLGTTLIGMLVSTAATGVALGAALGITGLTILYFFVNGATSLAVDAIWDVLHPQCCADVHITWRNFVTEWYQ